MHIARVFQYPLVNVHKYGKSPFFHRNLTIDGHFRFHVEMDTIYQDLRASRLITSAPERPQLPGLLVNDAITFL